MSVESPRLDIAVSASRQPRRLLGARLAAISLIGLGLLALFSLAAWPLAHVLRLDPDATDLFARYAPPSPTHWLGTDEAGRDELVRLMLGGQISLLIGLAATLLASAIGLAVGLATGYFGGALDTLLMRLADGIIALPLLPLLIVLSAVDLTKLGLSAEFARSGAAGFWRLAAIISLVEWTTLARVARAATLSINERDFVRAAHAIGASPLRILTRHILPNIAGPVIVTITLTVGRVILFEAILSFLGFGIAPPTPSWGNMLTNAQELVTTAPMLAAYPGVLIFLTVVMVNVLGDGLTDTLDPRGKR